jgi:hypothetical protein
MSSTEFLADAEQRLEQALSEYETTQRSAAAAEFYELRLQAAIFNYDVCRTIAGLLRDEPKGFALKVCLRDLVHKLYEYDQSLSERLVKRILDLAQVRGVDLKDADIRAERAKWKQHLSKLQSWASLRNQTAAHYGKNIPEQVRLIGSLEREDVLAVARAFLSFNVAVLRELARIGRG